MSIKRCTKPIMWKENLRRITEQSEPLENQINIPWFILNPEGRTVRYWSRFMSLLLIYTAIITPYRIGFIQQDDLTWSIVEYLVSLLFFIDLVMNCILPYYDKDKTLITAPKQIFLSYLFSWLVPDLLACLPFSLFFNANKQYNSMIRVMRLPRLYRLTKITKLLRMVKVMKNTSTLIKQVKIILRMTIVFETLFWFLFTYFLLIHLVACMWVFIGTLDITSMNWVLVGNYDEYSNQDLYLVSLYWTITTVSTVGYGDIVPVNLVEKIFTTVVMTIGIVFYSYSISTLSNLLANLDYNRSKLKNQKILLDKLTAEYRLNNKFYLELAQALEYASSSSKIQLDEILDNLPHNLSNQVILAVYEKQIVNNAFFDQKSTTFVAWVANRLKLFKCKEKSFIYYEGDYANQMYFIIEGAVEFIIECEDNEISFLELDKDYYFGETDMICSLNKSRHQTVRATRDCDLLTFSKENFIKMLNFFDSEGTLIMIDLNRRFKRIEKKCNEAISNVKTKAKIVKEKSTPFINKMNSRISHRSSGMEYSWKNKTMFKEIFDEKQNVKERRIKAIMMEARKLERDAREALEIAFRAQAIMLEKYPNFGKKYSSTENNIYFKDTQLYSCVLYSLSVILSIISRITSIVFYFNT